MTKYIFVTGGVVSGLGKGITAASLGRLLKARGLKVAAQKLDPYINVDPGTMSPYQHGEVYVTEDGAETDLDLGHYERFIDEDLNQYSNLTTGKVYSNVISKERRGAYLGATVQTIPHITDEIKRFIYNVGSKTEADVVITEVGGTIGDIESQPFIEAIRQVGHEVGPGNALYIHVTLVPYLKASGEHKSKPTQHSVKELQGLGITPDIIVLRCDEPITDPSIFRKIAGFCNVKPDCVIENLTLPILYEAPLYLERANLSAVVCRELRLSTPEPDLSQWQAMVAAIKSRSKSVSIGLVGKYVQLHDAYLSVAEALRHAGFALGAKVDIQWIDSETVTADTQDELLSQLDGILVPGGFGSRGIEGMILAAQYAREHRIPYLGICLGMQIAVIEFARHVLGLTGADSGEFAPECRHKVIDFMPGQGEDIDKGGTLRLGSYPCVIAEGTTMARCYGGAQIWERHRHRYEFNNDYRDALRAAGMTISGLSPDGRLVEAVELSSQPFYVGVQYHPEFKSRPTRPHPLFQGFLAAALESGNERFGVQQRHNGQCCQQSWALPAAGRSSFLLKQKGHNKMKNAQRASGRRHCLLSDALCIYLDISAYQFDLFQPIKLRCAMDNPCTGCMTDTTAAPSEGAQRVQQIHAEGQHHTRAGLCQKALQYHTRLQHAGSSYAGRKWYYHRESSITRIGGKSLHWNCNILCRRLKRIRVRASCCIQ